MTKKFIALYIAGVSLWGAAVYLVITHAPRAKRIDCSMAEFHPDFTSAMREQCRAARPGRML